MRARLIAFALLFAPMSASPAVAQREDAAIVAELNRVRADPAGYADELRAYRKRFRGKLVSLPGLPHGLMTGEGVAAVDEAIRFMERQRPLHPLRPGPLLVRAAADHVRDQGPIAGRGHVGTDRTTPGQRVKRHGGDIYVGESITYGPVRPDDVIRQLIIDDRVPDRGHRKMLFDPRWHHAGAVCGPHKGYGRMCVINFADTANGGPRLP